MQLGMCTGCTLVRSDVVIGWCPVVVARMVLNSHEKGLLG